MAKWYSSETQIRWVCLQLLKGREISHADEISEAKGWRLAPKIHNLKKIYRWPILTRYGRNGIAYYRLAKGIDKDSLRKPASFTKKKRGAGTPHKLQ